MRWSLLVLACLVSACGEKEAAKAPPPKPPKVTVSTPTRQDIVPHYEITGRTRATEIVEIRARVTGFLQEMRYEVGDRTVKQGDILFVIEKENYISLRDQAKAELQSAEASADRAKSDYERFKKAAETNAVSKVQVTLAKAQMLSNDAKVIGAKAALRQAELNLSYCDVRSPIEGLPARNLVDIGNLVSPGNNALLTTVVKRKPIYVYFEIPEKYVNQALKERAMREQNADKAPTVVKVAVPGGEFEHEGIVDYVDNTVDPSTGTLRARGVFDNEDGFLYSGVYVRVRIIGTPIPNQVMIEERAIGTDMGGKFVFVLDKENVVERRYIQLGKREGLKRVVTKGLKGDERYVVVGVLRARPGLKAEPVEAKGES